MSLFLGDTAPDFKAVTTEGVISFHQYLGNSWGILLSHPGDFTPVCTTEIGRTAQLHESFKSRNVKVLVVSVDGIEDHYGWINDINLLSKTEVAFPLIADPGAQVAGLYGMIHPNASGTATVRSVFIIDPDKKIRLMFAYPASTGRNFDEILRVIEELQQSDE